MITLIVKNPNIKTKEEFNNDVKIVIEKELQKIINE